MRVFNSKCHYAQTVGDFEGFQSPVGIYKIISMFYIFIKLAFFSKDPWCYE